MNELRGKIARAILMVTQGNVPVEYAWNAQFEEVQDELLAQADAAIEALGLREEWYARYYCANGTTEDYGWDGLTRTDVLTEWPGSTPIRRYVTAWEDA